ncbi:hypothetical protein HDU84_003740 [Entophlyctis sp. JEL0112]|nr:hypothetical protein HDU84_003740 [Entophlyctis sp. JEL0112]
MDAFAAVVSVSVSVRRRSFARDRDGDDDDDDDDGDFRAVEVDVSPPLRFVLPLSPSAKVSTLPRLLRDPLLSMCSLMRRRSDALRPFLDCLVESVQDLLESASFRNDQDAELLPAFSLKQCGFTAQSMPVLKVVLFNLRPQATDCLFHARKRNISDISRETPGRSNNAGVTTVENLNSPLRKKPRRLQSPENEGPTMDSVVEDSQHSQTTVATHTANSPLRTPSRISDRSASSPVFLKSHVIPRETANLENDLQTPSLLTASEKSSDGEHDNSKGSEIHSTMLAVNDDASHGTLLSGDATAASPKQETIPGLTSKDESPVFPLHEIKNTTVYQPASPPRPMVVDDSEEEADGETNIEDERREQTREEDDDDGDATVDEHLDAGQTNKTVPDDDDETAHEDESDQAIQISVLDGSVSVPGEKSKAVDESVALQKFATEVSEMKISSLQSETTVDSLVEIGNQTIEISDVQDVEKHLTQPVVADKSFEKKNEHHGESENVSLEVEVTKKLLEEAKNTSISDNEASDESEYEYEEIQVEVEIEVDSDGNEIPGSRRELSNPRKQIEDEDSALENDQTENAEDNDDVGLGEKDDRGGSDTQITDNSLAPEMAHEVGINALAKDDWEVTLVNSPPNLSGLTQKCMTEPLSFDPLNETSGGNEGDDEESDSEDALLRKINKCLETSVFARESSAEETLSGNSNDKLRAFEGSGPLFSQNSDEIASLAPRIQNTPEKKQIDSQIPLLAIPTSSTNTTPILNSPKPQVAVQTAQSSSTPFSQHIPPHLRYQPAAQHNYLSGSKKPSLKDISTQFFTRKPAAITPADTVKGGDTSSTDDDGDAAAERAGESSSDSSDSSATGKPQPARAQPQFAGKAKKTRRKSALAMLARDARNSRRSSDLHRAHR